MSWVQVTPEREFQPMVSSPDENSLSSDQNTNRFLV